MDRIATTIDELTAMAQVQQLCRVTAGDHLGWGVLEQLVLGPHTPSGLTGVLDGAK